MASADERRTAIERTRGLFAHLAPGESLVDELIEDRRTEGESEMAPLPTGWGRMRNGEPMPDVAAAVRRSRESH
jgi:hypothetical protein